eukprot:4398680-Pyramimonas_sp.AAC.1
MNIFGHGRVSCRRWRQNNTTALCIISRDHKRGAATNDKAAASKHDNSVEDDGRQCTRHSLKRLNGERTPQALHRRRLTTEPTRLLHPAQLHPIAKRINPQPRSHVRSRSKA